MGRGKRAKLKWNRQLLQSAQAGNLYALEEALRNGAQINAGGHGGRALILSISYKHWAYVDRLLAVPGIDIAAMNDFGRIAFLTACREGNLSLVQRLVSLGIDPQPQRNHEGETGLHKACYYCHYNIVWFLLVVCKCDPMEGNDFWTALHAACSRPENNVAIVTLLLEHGAKISSRTVHNDTPLRFAVKDGGNLSTIRLLLHRGACIDDKDNAGGTALHWAVGHVQPSIGVMQELLSRRPNLISQRNNRGKTPLDWRSKGYDARLMFATICWKLTGANCCCDTVPLLSMPFYGIQCTRMRHKTKTFMHPCIHSEWN